MNVVASVIFAGMSGPRYDAGGLGAVEIKAMRDAGYDDGFTLGITAASSTIDRLFPQYDDGNLWCGSGGLLGGYSQRE